MSILEKITLGLFIADLMCLYTLIIGEIWSIIQPTRRIWPPPQKKSWQHRITWSLFYIVFLLNSVLVVLDWNSWIFKNFLRLLISIPLIFLGTFLFSWGIKSLGIKNTSGIKERFVLRGPYRFTRNPQYLGGIIFFFGMIITTNSLYGLITHVLLILVYIIAPFTEEIWLEEQYGQEYISYMKKVPRFI